MCCASIGEVDLKLTTFIYGRRRMLEARSQCKVGDDFIPPIFKERRE